MVKAFFTFCGIFVRVMVVMLTSFLLFCMNTFTIPVTVLLWLICRLFKLRTPHFTNYSLMVYPTWNRKPNNGLWEDMQKIKRKEDAKIPKYRPLRPWEARFFD